MLIFIYSKSFRFTNFSHWQISPLMSCASGSLKETWIIFLLAPMYIKLKAETCVTQMNMKLLQGSNPSSLFIWHKPPECEWEWIRDWLPSSHRGPMHFSTTRWRPNTVNSRSRHNHQFYLFIIFLFFIIYWYNTDGSLMIYGGESVCCLVFSRRDSDDNIKSFRPFLCFRSSSCFWFIYLSQIFSLSLQSGDNEHAGSSVQHYIHIHILIWASPHQNAAKTLQP